MTNTTLSLLTERTTFILRMLMDCMKGKNHF